MTRREFLAKGAAGAAALGAAAVIPSHAFGANDRISIGVIGAGNQGLSLMTQVNSNAKDQNAEITAICDTWRVRRRQIAAKVQEWTGRLPRTFDDYEDLLALSDVDAVIIATPDFAHTQILTDTLKSGKDAYVEKPMAGELQLANAAMDAFQGSGRIVQAGTQRRSDGRWKAAARLVQSGVLGKVSRVEIAWNDNSPRWKRSVDDLKPEDVNWRRYLMHLPYRPWDPHQYREWQLHRDFTTGPLGLLGTHFLDVVHWYTGDTFPSTAVSNGGIYLWPEGREHEDTMTSLWDYPAGFLCSYTTGLGNAVGNGCRIYGMNGMFSDATWSISGAGGAAGSAIKEEINIQSEDNENHVANWLKCVRTRETPNAPFEAAYQHSVAGILAYQALRRKRKMRYLPETREIIEA